ncbi:hypothetical protein B7463_g4072, partial [Scytalidium lignicola]
MNPKVADLFSWSQGIPHEQDELEYGPATCLFDAATAAFTELLRIIAAGATTSESKSLYESLRNEFQKFYMWNEGFSTRTGNLDSILSRSKNLEATCLSLLALWANAVSKVPKVLPQYDWSFALPKFAKLEELAGKLTQISTMSMKQIEFQYPFLSNSDEKNTEGDSSDSDTSSEVSIDDYSFGDIIEDLSSYIDSLTDLSVSLDNPATDYSVTYYKNSAFIDGLSGISEPARALALVIQDEFPSLDIGLVRKLGEANWQRRERLQRRYAFNGKAKIGLSTNDDDSSVGGTDLSVTTRSEFSEPSLFDGQSESTTLSTLSGTDRLRQRRVPSLPKDYQYGTPFQCPFCGDSLSIWNHKSWKKHVYNDLEPGSLQHHFSKIYAESVIDTQMNDILSASRRLVPCNIEEELCPFCSTAPADTQNGYILHVGKHQREISLAALLNLNGILDDECDNDNSSDDETVKSHGTISGGDVVNNSVMAENESQQDDSNELSSEMEEEDDTVYKVHTSADFRIGHIFQLLWSEPYGSTGTDTENEPEVKTGATVYCSIRRFIVINSRHPGHSTCIPILTYRGRGTTTRGVDPEMHSIVYSSEDPPGPQKGEDVKALKPPIKVVIGDMRNKLDRASRINYSKVYTVEHNVKVLFIGKVDASFMYQLLANYEAVNKLEELI